MTFAVTFVLVALGPASASQLQGQAAPVRRSFDVRVPVPPTPVPVAGVRRLVYELHVTNFAREPLIPRHVEVLDAETGATIAEVPEDLLYDRLGRLEAPSAEANPRSIAPGTHAVVYLEVGLEDGASPRELEHRVVYHGADDPDERAAVQGGRVQVQTEPAARGRRSTEHSSHGGPRRCRRRMSSSPSKRPLRCPNHPAALQRTEKRRCMALSER